MFRGIFNTTIDGKGRTSLPAKFREVLVEAFGDERFFLTNSNPVRLGDGVSCSGLAIYPYQEWIVLEEKLVRGTGLGLSSVQLAAVKRRIIAPAVECSADKLGRILVPPHLRKSASLEREIVFAGLLNKAEIWSLAEWEKVYRQDDDNFPGDSQALADLGL
ncbi:MAG: transcriptional regulator MraZ [Deltaproteobacteria bacterium]|nr:transcriptional regulator MraZ [Deltaproteobacteria bacterium]